MYACGRSLLAVLVVSTLARHARAQAGAATVAPTYQYSSVVQPNVWRMGLEEIGILAAGIGYYFLDRDTNALDWTYDYEWETLEAKLTGDGYSFDTNYFKTNTLSHSGAGALYYIAARGNRLTVPSSLAIAFLTSSAWEVLAEFRERVSINDLFITPLGGFAFGESMSQVGALFDRGCDSELFRVLGSFFGPSRSVHDWMDGAELARATSCNRDGFALTGLHRIRLSAGTALAAGGGSGMAGRNWIEGAARIDVTHLTSIGRQSGGWTVFSDGNIARLEARLRGEIGYLHDVHLHARAIAFGAHYGQPSHRSPMSADGAIGLGAGVIYSEHQYGEEDESRDPWFVLEAPTLYARFWSTVTSHEFFVSLAVAPTLAEVGAFALREYAQDHDLSALTPIARQRRYNHALGVAVHPELGWSSTFHEFSLALRLDRLFPIRSLIGDQRASSDVPLREARRQARLSLALGSDRTVRFRTDLHVDQRSGSIAQVSRVETEVTWSSGIELRY